MQFSSIAEANAAFALGPLTFRCLACGGRHRWDPRKDVSQAIRSCLHSVWLKSDMLWSERFAIADCRHALMPYFSMPTPSFWVDMQDLGYIAERRLLREAIAEALGARLARVDDLCHDDTALFTAYTRSDSERRRDERRLTVTERPFFLALAPDVARLQVLQHVRRVWRRRLADNQRLLDAVAPGELASRYRVFVDRYCSRLLPERDMWFVYSGYTGLRDGTAQVAPFVDASGFAGAVRRCIAFILPAGGYPAPSCFRNPGHIPLPKLLRCGPSGAFVACKQDGSLMNVWHTDDYVMWRLEACSVPELPLACLEEAFAGLQAVL